ncbi:MAG TPA: hypothetical protein PK520_04545 [Exilispira sp.]|jgi:putative aminopeptidase FrvX|nr:hypothetical protein [Spirochaetota bacterium]HNV43438.1 hypothetical protein [Exilispira sp.]HQM89107.1 hypothetical protein [Exilispira sp.]HQQ19336.1 hypothetical protein [Exilispira sp.]
MEKYLDIISDDELVSSIKTLISTPSPTGYTKEAEAFLLEYAKKYSIDARKTEKGAVIYNFGSDNAKKGSCFAAHIDTLGLMVRSVNGNSVKFVPINGIPPIYAVGDYCTIMAYDGNRYRGTILPDNPSVHVNKDIRDVPLKYDKFHIRVDYRFSEDEPAKKKIFPGDFIFLDPKFDFIEGFVKTRFLDDKASAGLFLVIAKKLKEAEKKGQLKLKKNIYFYFNITEETGQGISSLPDVDNLYIVDMGVVGDEINGDEFSVSLCPMDSSGPYNYDLTRELETLCIENKLDYKKDIFPYYGSDGSAALRACKDIKVALFGVGVNASHGYERAHIDGLKNTYNLLKSVILKECIE